MKHYKHVILTLAVVSALNACRETSSPQSTQVSAQPSVIVANTAPTNTMPANPQSNTPAKSEDKPLANVNGRSISQGEFQAYLSFKNISEQHSGRVKSALESYLKREAVASAIEQGDYLDTSKTQVEINEFKKQDIFCI